MCSFLKSALKSHPLVLSASHPFPNMGLCCHSASGGMQLGFCAQVSPSMASDCSYLVHGDNSGVGGSRVPGARCSWHVRGSSLPLRAVKSVQQHLKHEENI